MYEIARESGISSKELLDRLPALGIEAASHMTAIEPGDVQRIKQAISEQRHAAGQQGSPPVLRRRRRRPARQRPAEQRAEARPEPKPSGKPSAQAAPPPREQRAEREASKPAQRERAQAGDLSARERFDRELQEARRRTEERRLSEEATQKQEEPQPANVSGRTPGRPAVGDVIALPSRTLIRVRERARPGGQPATEQTPGRGAAPAAPARPVQKRLTPRKPGGRHERRRPGGIRGGPRGARARKAGPARPPSTKPAAEHKRVVKIHDTVAVDELARSMGVKATEVLKKLWGMGMMGVTINAAIDADAAGAVASEFGYEVKNVAFQEEAVLEIAPDVPEALVPRAPVVTVMGHVDHGKTTLLDAIRTARVASGEAGGITQHIAAYRVPAPAVGKVGEVVFLDTPGHEAFTAMRARGAQATDVVVLVVAANDGVMPQTIEALDHARDANVPVVVAVNKIDAPNAQPERVRQQLAERGLIPEEWGGDTLYIDVSALQRLGIDDLLASLALQADLLALEANPDKPAVGVVIEARLDRARGPLATMLVQQGTLRVGDTIVAGEHSGKVRALLDEHGASLEAAGPSVPVQVLGLDGVPEAGEVVNATDEKTARQLVEHRVQDKRKRQRATLGKVSLESMMTRLQAEEALELKIVLKTDVHGSAEALGQALERLSTAKVSVNVIHTGVGGVTESDVNLAKAGGAIIVGFNVRPAGKAASVAKSGGVEIRLYDVIYEALDDVKAAMVGLLPPVRREHALGKAEVREVFRITGVGLVAGCMVTTGTVRRSARARLIRNAVQVHEGVIRDLKRFKEDVAEVHQGYECGIHIDGTNDVRVGDVIEAYQIVEEAQTLE